MESANELNVAAETSQNEKSAGQNGDRDDMGTTRFGSDTDLAGQRSQQLEENVDPRTREVMFGGKKYMATAFSEDCYKDEYRRLARIPWFRCEAVRSAADDEYASLLRYTTDGRFFWYVTAGKLPIGAWRDLYAVGGEDLGMSGPVFVMRILHMHEIMSGGRGVEFDIGAIDRPRV